MITFLNGKLVSALPTHAIIDVGGVGYEVFIPLSSYDRLPEPGHPFGFSHIWLFGKTRMCFTDS